MSVAFAAIVYDFDGVIADSETLSNVVLAEEVTALGVPTTLKDALIRYQGKRWTEVIETIEADLGHHVPAGFSNSVADQILRRFTTDLEEVPGAIDFVRAHQYLPHCIASSSSPLRLATSLERLNLTSSFADRVFSADMVERGKPYPDIFLFAAARLQVDPERCLVIEDSISGVKAGKAAGMTVVGLCAASHLMPGHSERMLEAGADFVAGSWSGAATWIGERNKDGQ